MDSPRSPDNTNASSPPAPSLLASSADADLIPESPSKSMCSIRFLISNAAAGSVIGKGGSTISEFQSQSGARIQLSRNHEYFPGTTDRIMVLSGTISEVLTACHLILSKILNEVESESVHDIKTNQVRLVVPNSVCGAIIGKAGTTIKAFVEDSHANIKLSSQEQSIPGLNDRIVTITGKLEHQLRAIALIITKLSEDANYAQYASSPISYAGVGTSLLGLQSLQGRFAAATITPVGYGVTPYGSGGVNNFHTKSIMPPIVAVPAAPVQLSVPVVPSSGPLTTFVTLAIPDEQVGIIVGRGGKTITDIQQTSGVRIKISDRGDFLAGTNNRKVTITGTADGVRVAQQLLTQKVQQNFVSDFER